MDTDPRYVDGAEFYVRMAGETEPDWVQEYNQRRIEDPDDPMCGFEAAELRDHHILDEDVPIDGQVQFYFPGRIDDPDSSGVWSFSFPFRDHRRDDSPWFAFPGKAKGKKHPVWKWQNPDAGRETLTLAPSLGVGDPMTFHCYIRDGEVDWL